LLKGFTLLNVFFVFYKKLKVFIFHADNHPFNLILPDFDN